jgi:hypothetical protein
VLLPSQTSVVSGMNKIAFIGFDYFAIASESLEISYIEKSLDFWIESALAGSTYIASEDGVIYLLIKNSPEA